LLTNKQRQAQLATDYSALRQILGEGGHASGKAAESIYRFMRT